MKVKLVVQSDAPFAKLTVTKQEAALILALTGDSTLVALVDARDSSGDGKSSIRDLDDDALSALNAAVFDALFNILSDEGV